MLYGGGYKSAVLTSSVALFAGLRHLSRFCADALAQPTHVTSCSPLTNTVAFNNEPGLRE